MSKTSSVGWLSTATAALGALLVASVVVMAALAAPLSHFAPNDQDRDHFYESPAAGPLENAPRHLLGTDALGRDIWSRTLHGARFSLTTSIAGAVLAAALGGLIGIGAGWLGGFFDRISMRMAELMMALPALYLILGIRNLFPDVIGPSVAAAVVVVSLASVGWTVIARIVRARVLSLREQDFIEAARASGASSLWIVRRHLAPNLWPYLLLQLGLSVPYFLLGEVSMSYLGLGLAAPDPSWGNMLADGVNISGTRWWTWLPPAGFLTSTVIGINLVVDKARTQPEIEALGGGGAQDSVPVGS